MKIVINKSTNFKMQAVNENGNILAMDASQAIGGDESAFRPMQLLLAAIGGCSTIDVVAILKKQKQEVTFFEVEVDGQREQVEEYSLFKTIVLHFKIQGNIDKDKAERAIQLSLEKYCSVAKTLEPTANITYTLRINS